MSAYHDPPCAYAKSSSLLRNHLQAGCNFAIVWIHELHDANERLSRQHVLLLCERSFWHSGLIDRLQVSKSCRTHCQTAVGFVFLGTMRQQPSMSTGGEVANAAACKAVIHGFDSHPVLQKFRF